MFRKRDRPPLSPEALASRRRLRRWYLWTGLALFPLDLAWTGFWVGFVVLLIFPGPDLSDSFRLEFLAFLLAMSAAPMVVYFLWTWFTLGWRIVPPHSVLLWAALCAFNVAEALSALPNLPSRYQQLANTAIPQDLPALFLERPDILVLAGLGFWLLWKRLAVGEYGCLAFQWCLFSCFVWGAYPYYGALKYVVLTGNMLW